MASIIDDTDDLIKKSIFIVWTSADPTVHKGASFKKMLNEIEALLANGYMLKYTIECNGEIFAFLLNLN
jgi:hypothetical protein